MTEDEQALEIGKVLLDILKDTYSSTHIGTVKSVSIHPTQKPMTKEHADRHAENCGYSMFALFETIKKTIASLADSCEKIQAQPELEQILLNNKRWLFFVEDVLRKAITPLWFLRDCSKHPRYNNSVDTYLEELNSIQG
jgi:hypothetical protein